MISSPPSYRSENAVSIYLGIRTVAAVALVLLALVFQTFITSNPVLGIVLPIAAGLLGYFGPSFVLDHMITMRQERIRYGLPDALDLMVVCVEAGLGMDQAMQYVATELMKAHPDICQELEMANLEMRGGKRRTEAPPQSRGTVRRTGAEKAGCGPDSNRSVWH